MPITIVNFPSDIFFSTNYNKRLNKQLNGFLKTNIYENPIKPLQTQIFSEVAFLKGGINYPTRPVYVHFSDHSDR